ncbi:MAG: DUF1080 domain-containing protein [Opitutaceae bacterium]|nr:DUF1080 domain-containing protein [Opitutaceae bacterium]
MLAPALRRRLLIPLVAFVAIAALASASEPAPITPTKPIVFFDGKDVADLSRFYTWLGPLGKDNDPHRVFTVVDHIDGARAIRVSGEDWGGIVTRDAYANYKLILEFRWGSVTWGSRKDRARNSGILLHLQGQDGNYKQDFKGHWTSSIEYEILEGRMGDIILVSGFVPDSKDKIAPRLTMTQSTERIWDPKGTPKVFTSGMGHLHWQKWDPNWKDVLGFRGEHDLDKLLGGWNVAEIIADGNRLTYFFNGEKVMEGTDVSPAHGKLLFQSEGAEIFFRRIELQPLPR